MWQNCNQLRLGYEIRKTTQLVWSLPSTSVLWGLPLIATRRRPWTLHAGLLALDRLVRLHFKLRDSPLLWAEGASVPAVSCVIVRRSCECFSEFGAEWVKSNHLFAWTARISSAIAERPARRSVSVEMLSYCCTNTANRRHVSPMSTFSNCHVLFRYLHSFVHKSFNYCTASIRCRGCHQQTSIQSTLLMWTGP